MEEDRISFEMLSGKPIVKRHLGTPRCRLEDSIRIYIKEMVSILGIVLL